LLEDYHLLKIGLLVDKKVLLLADFVGDGGTKTYFFYLVDFLVKRGFSVHAYLPELGALTINEREKLVGLGVVFNAFPGYLMEKKGILLRLGITELLRYFFLRSLKDNFLRVIVSSGKSFEFISGARIWGKRFCFFLHTYPQGSPSLLSRSIRPFRRMYFSVLAKTGFSFITPTFASKRIILDQKGLEEKHLPVTVISNPAVIGITMQTEEDSKMVVTIGHFEKWKNPQFWIQVAKEVVSRDKDVVFVWGGTGSMEEDIKSQIPEEYSKNILMPGYVEDIDKLLDQAVVYFQPSLVESQGISVVEAMGHSVPCVVSNIGGLPEVVEDGVSGFVVELDVMQTADKILSILASKELSERMGREALQRYHDEYTLEMWEKRIDQVLFLTEQD